jgi:hypothetical protein
LFALFRLAGPANMGSGPRAARPDNNGVNGTGPAPPAVIDGPATVLTGEQPAP